MSECQACPLRGRETACLGATEPTFTYFCARAAEGDPAWLRMIADRSEVGYTPPVAMPGADTVPGEPGLLRKATTLGKAIVQHVAAGRPTADDATVEARWATCRACPMFDAAGMICRACGCHLEIKIRWAEQRCPIGKW